MHDDLNTAHQDVTLTEGADPVVSLAIRRPGCTAWADLKTTDMRSARRELARADQVAPGHRIIGTRESGATVVLE